MAADKSHPEYQYLDLMQDILDNGSDKKKFLTPEVKERYKKQGKELPYIRSVFGRQMRFDLAQGFPLLTTKKTFLRGIIIELLWFLRGDSNIKYLVDNKVHIWDEWAYVRFKKAQVQSSKFKVQSLNKYNKYFKTLKTQEEFIQYIKDEPADSKFVKEWGELLTVYGRMWRRWPASDGREIDQIAWIIQGLKKRPFRKSYVVSAWNPDFIYEMASHGHAREVPPFCHTLFQLAVTHGNRLNLGLYQRSADLFLGVPFNIASYALLLLMIAQVTNLKPGEFVHTFGDVHLYSNHFDQARKQLTRKPRPFPTMKLNHAVKNIDDFKYEDFTLEGYNPHPPIKGEITVVGGF